MQNIAILGRGLSLQCFPAHSDEFSVLYLVNNFGKEIKLFGLEHFKHKKLIHMVGRGPNNLSRSLYKELNIPFVQSNSFNATSFRNAKRYPIPVRYLPEQMRRRGYPPLEWSYFLKLSKRYSYDQISQIVKNFWAPERGWPTTGLLAIDLALMTEETDQISLFGMDLYREKYLVKKNKPYQTAKWAKSKMMAVYLRKLVQEFKQTKFFTYSKVEFPEENWINK